MIVSSEQLELIDSIASMLSPSFTFGYYDVDDIEQEIRLMCLEALPRFNPDKASLRTFLVVHARNRLITLKRDKSCKIFPPCSSCNHLDGRDCVKYKMRDNCSLYAKWNRTTKDKYNLLALSSLDENDMAYHTNIVEELHQQELLKYVDEHIPARYRQDYLNFIENGKMTTYAKQNIKRIIKDIAADYLM